MRPSAYPWSRAVWTSAIALATAAGSLMLGPQPDAGEVPGAVTGAMVISLATLPLLVKGRIPERWLPGGRLWITAAKWSRLILLPLLLMALMAPPGTVRDVAGVHRWLLPSPGAWPSLGLTALGVGLWCLMQWRFRPPRLFRMLGRSSRVSLVLTESAQHILHNGVPEEFYYRLLLQSWLVQHLPWPLLGVLASALLFGLVHLLWAGPRSRLHALLDAVLVQAPLGLMLGCAWLSSTWLPGVAALHAAIDTVVTLDQGAAQALARRARRKAQGPKEVRV